MHDESTMYKHWLKAFHPVVAAKNNLRKRLAVDGYGWLRYELKDIATAMHYGTANVDSLFFCYPETVSRQSSSPQLTFGK